MTFCNFGMFELTVDRIREPGWRCKAKVNFDTMVDKSFFTLQKVRYLDGSNRSNNF